ncbi:hypothetical protein PSHT_09384 [Puccinia striiformis]|uniref:serine C-palmitoyltransferase n=1 Tax=Puccinia striiformis TaxID=27350 RepID=A0A2S4VH33_9BASI|nr:hypothetical protein PSHT_09384 [Puccinia striiformis]
MLEPFSSEFTPYLEYLSKTANFILKLIKLIPGSDILIRYVKSSHQNDPFRTLLELSLVFFIIRTWRQSRTRGDVGSGKSFVKLTEKEIDELIAEWKPEPLVEAAAQTTQATSQPPIIVGIPTARAKILHGEAAKRFIENPSHDSPIDPNDIIEVTNLASINFAGLIGHEEIKRRAIEQLRRSGVGSCGPPGFYGTFDVHMELERDIADFLGLQNSIITLKASQPLHRWFDHNDMGSLEKVLEQLQYEEIKYRRKLTRKFIITEALFESDGQICDLPAIIELKEKFKFRLISMRHGRLAVWEKLGEPKSVDILVGSLATSFNSGGGFCAGSNEVVSHQRINSAALVFSAALPPLLATAASESIKILREGDGVDRFEKLRKNIKIFREILKPITGDPMSDDGLIEIPSHENSPLIHITLKSPQQQPPGSAARTTMKGKLNIELSPNWSPRQLANQALPASAGGSKLCQRRFEEQEALLQKIVDLSIEEKNVLITRTKKVWEQEIDPMSPSLRICISEALATDHLVQAANSLFEVFKQVLLD